METRNLTVELFEDDLDLISEALRGQAKALRSRADNLESSLGYDYVLYGGSVARLRSKVERLLMLAKLVENIREY